MIVGCLHSVDTVFFDTRPGWQDKVAVCCLQDELLPMKMVADEGEVGHN